MLVSSRPLYLSPFPSSLDFRRRRHLPPVATKRRSPVVKVVTGVCKVLDAASDGNRGGANATKVTISALAYSNCSSKFGKRDQGPGDSLVKGACQDTIGRDGADLVVEGGIEVF